MLRLMSASHLGRDVKLLRKRRRWTERRLAAAAGVSPSSISLLELGGGDRLTVRTLTAVVDALDARLAVRVYWHGEALDRLRDERHAAIVEAVVRRLIADGWTSRAEVSFNEFGERGAIDVLAHHPTTEALLVIEVKSVVSDVQDLLSRLDRKKRLAPAIARSLGRGDAPSSRK